MEFSTRCGARKARFSESAVSHVARHQVALIIFSSLALRTMSSIPQTDIVFVNSLELSANVGPDRWGKSRPQPVLVTVCLHLHSSYLVSVGKTDDVRDSVHYGHLSKAIANIVETDNTFSGINGLVDVVTKAAFELAGEAAAAVKVIVDLRQMVLLANGFSVEVTTPAGTSSKDASAKVIVKDMSLPIIIGVNSPERESKQQVIINIVFFEKANNHSPVDYQKILVQISKVRGFGYSMGHQNETCC
jgi:FolB domain-containing protein